MTATELLSQAKEAAVLGPEDMLIVRLGSVTPEVGRQAADMLREKLGDRVFVITGAEQLLVVQGGAGG